MPVPCAKPRPPPTAQDWGSELFEALKSAGGRAYSNYAVGYNNVKVPEATKRGIPVGNTPGERRGAAAARRVARLPLSSWGMPAARRAAARCGCRRAAMAFAAACQRPGLLLSAAHHAKPLPLKRQS